MAKEFMRISFVQRDSVDSSQNQMMQMRKTSLAFVLNEDLGLKRILNLRMNIMNDRRSKAILMEQTIWASVLNTVEVLRGTSKLVQNITR
jgi:hypothetical protein